MRSVLGFLGVLLALISTGHSLSCIKCVSLKSTSCNGPNITCPSDRMCGAVYTETTENGVEKSKRYKRDCVRKIQCGAEGSMTVMKIGRYKTSTTCCDTDLCTPHTPKLPRESIYNNGVVCQTCVSSVTDWCLAKNHLMCTGNETKCIQASKVTAGANPSKFAYRGCATDTICVLKTMSADDDDDDDVYNIDTYSKYTCTSGIFALYHGFTFPFTVAILLAKLLS